MSTAAELTVATGDRFFQLLTEYMVSVLEADFACVSELLPGTSSHAIALATAPNGPITGSYEFDLAGTPEGAMLNSGLHTHREAVPQLFPADTRLTQMNAKAWSGAVLTGSRGQTVGMLSVLFSRPLNGDGAVEATLQSFGPRAAAEIEHRQTEEALRQSEAGYKKFIELTKEGVWRVDCVPPIPLGLPEDEFLSRIMDARVQQINDVSARMLGYDFGRDLVGRRICDIPEALPYRVAQFREQIRTGFPPRIFEFRAVDRNGKECWLERAELPLIENGKLVRVWGITRDVSERKRNEKQIQDLNANLERLVADRTAQLEAANQELEAFSYSVSHDLRSAIQGIVACSRIVVSDYASKLDEDGRRWLTHIADDAQQLDELTRALLELSRVSRAGIGRGQVDFSSLAHSICERLAAADPDRKARLHIHEGLLACADPVLLRGVMENLLGNAWKFTRTRETAEIEVGTRDGQPGDPVFFVRDNGVGFDMKYADKLFGAFQRLHRVEDFEGSGIGLATVRRVVHRHGGRVWAEGEVERGATFCFTLGKVDGA